MKKRTETYLRRHSKYVDYRIARIASSLFPSGAGQADVTVSSVISFLMCPSEQVPDSFSSESAESLLELRALMKQWDILSDGDILGYIYQQLQYIGDRKKKGQFFTPGSIVEYIIRSSVSSSGVPFPELRILDPACGSGQFLLKAYECLLEKFTAAGIPVETASGQIISSCLRGADTDETAVRIAKYNLAAVSGCRQEDVHIVCCDFLDRTAAPDFYFSGFHIIAGNPPWGGKLSGEQKAFYMRNYLSSSSGINTFTLFIERACDFLQPGGILSFLVPEAYLNIKAHRVSRKLICSCTDILSITLWGEQFRHVFAPSVSFMVRIRPLPAQESSGIVRILRGDDPGSSTEQVIPQAAFSASPDIIFNINYSRKTVNLISAIEESSDYSLADGARFYLGIVTGNNNRFVSSSRSDEYPDPIITGKDLNPFYIGFSSHYFRYDPSVLQQSAPRDMYLAKNKILYRFIGRNLTFAIDRSGRYSLNNVNGFIPEDSLLEGINLESLAAVLNSRVLQYYYENSFFTLKVLRSNLERLPIKRISPASQERLKLLSDTILYDGPPGTGTYARCRENMEDIILWEYGISDRDAFRMASVQ